ncbi:hypothetical protein [Aureivirga sp. CE67]|uniref:hypothetical protein n=1 Tax=Aureivirga sp. CE67 TaxID=1788983 RepID=UPI0018CB5025|nr:hypothetical protein [Aureivirga sp. CE67]
MINVVKINKIVGWILITGIIITQLIITKTTFDMGRMAPFYSFLTAMFFLPFIIIAITSVLSRKRNLINIKRGIKIGIFFQVILPLILPIFFDKEFIYVSLIGAILGLTMWFLRKKIEIQLLILNGIGVIIWSLISLVGI